MRSQRIQWLVWKGTENHIDVLIFTEDEYGN